MMLGLNVQIHMSLLISGEKALNNPKNQISKKEQHRESRGKYAGNRTRSHLLRRRKGKTTAAMGQAIRAAGSGLKVLVFQFMKDNSSSERKALEMIPNITLLPATPYQVL